MTTDSMNSPHEVIVCTSKKKSNEISSFDCIINDIGLKLATKVMVIWWQVKEVEGY